MRVTHILKATALAGAERHLMILLPELNARGVDMDLILLVEADKPMLDLRQQAVDAGVRVHPVIIRRDLDWRAYRKVRQLLQQIRPDLVHTHLIHGDFYGVQAANSLKIPVISSRHDGSDFRRGMLVRMVNRFLWRQITIGIAISHYLARFSIEVEGAAAHKLRVVQYGIPHQRQDPATIQAYRQGLRNELGLPEATLLIGINSRFVDWKGINYALDAWHEIAADYPQVHFILSGDGPERSNYEAQIARLNLPRVHFLGWRSDPIVVIGALDILLVPSLQEGFGLVMLEAMGLRVPVVASDATAMKEVIVHGETGLLVPPRDSSAIAEALAALLPDSALRHYLGHNGEDRLESVFNAGRMADETLAIYEEFRPIQTG